MCLTRQRVTGLALLFGVHRFVAAGSLDAWLLAGALGLARRALTARLGLPADSAASGRGHGWGPVR